MVLEKEQMMIVIALFFSRKGEGQPLGMYDVPSNFVVPFRGVAASQNLLKESKKMRLVVVIFVDVNGPLLEKCDCIANECVDQSVNTRTRNIQETTLCLCDGYTDRAVFHDGKNVQSALEVLNNIGIFCQVDNHPNCIDERTDIEIQRVDEFLDIVNMLVTSGFVVCLIDGDAQFGTQCIFVAWVNRECAVPDGFAVVSKKSASHVVDTTVVEPRVFLVAGAIPSVRIKCIVEATSETYVWFWWRYLRRRRRR